MCLIKRLLINYITTVSIIFRSEFGCLSYNLEMKCLYSGERSTQETEQIEIEKYPEKIVMEALCNFYWL